jgi:UDP-N-acetylmuramoyl-L-alanyl-D-glutamate--2,6-diaminopimelate ligase
MQVIAVTGTNGKTTTANMLAEILKAAGRSVGVIGTLGVYYNEKVYPSDFTTPDPIFLQKTLSEMYQEGIKYVVMEVSAHALYYQKTCGVRFVAGIFTNFTQDHLDFFSSMREYKRAKLKLFQSNVTPIAVVNADDNLSKEIYSLRKLSDEEGTTSTYFYGLKTPTDAFAVLNGESLNVTNFVININDELAYVQLKLIGTHNVYNALAASVCAKNLGVSIEVISKGLNAMKPVRGRLERIARYNGADIFIDFAHTPDGLEKSLRALKKHCKGRLICLFGCGGNRDKKKRPLMGEVASRIADFCYLTSDNPRNEEPLKIIEDIERGITSRFFDYVVIGARSQALKVAINGLKEGDVLLVAGKGGEDYQEIKGIKYPYKDEELIEEITQRG